MMMYGWIIGIILIVVLFFALSNRNMLRGPDQGKTSAPPGQTARDILDQRFAKGEISKSEYEGKKAELDKV